MGIVLAAGILAGSLIFCVVWFRRGQVTKSEPESGKLNLTVKEVEELVGGIGETIANGIRAALGLDMAAEVIGPAEDVEPVPGYVHDLEMDPFMRAWEELPQPEMFNDQES